MIPPRSRCGKAAGLGDPFHREHHCWVGVGRLIRLKGWPSGAATIPAHVFPQRLDEQIEHVLSRGGEVAEFYQGLVVLVPIWSIGPHATVHDATPDGR